MRALGAFLGSFVHLNSSIEQRRDESVQSESRRLHLAEAVACPRREKVERRNVDITTDSAKNRLPPQLNEAHHLKPELEILR